MATVVRIANIREILGSGVGGSAPLHYSGHTMQIGEAVYEALMRNEAAIFLIVADWIDEHRQDHPEASTYLKRLRSPGIRIRTVMDVVCKFGSRTERKLFSRINRILLEMRHRPERSLPLIDNVFNMDDRRRINRFLHVGPGDRTRKKPVLAMTRKRTVLHNDIWYVKALKTFLAKHYPPLVEGKKAGGDQ